MEALQKLLKEREIKYLIVPGSDAHNSEYLAPQDKRRAFVSGFDGSAGTALVGAAVSDSYLWTDGRYWLQASNQLDPKQWTLMKSGAPKVPTLEAKLAGLLSEGDKLGVDPRLITTTEMRQYSDLCKKAGATLEWCPGLVDEVWQERLNGLVNAQVQLMPDSVSGRSVSDKLQEVARSMKDKSVNHLILTMLDDIAWLLNLRGADIPFNPVFFAFAIVSLESGASAQTSVTLFIDPSKTTNPEVKAHLEALKVTIVPYDDFYSHLASNLKSESKPAEVWLDTSKSNSWTYLKLTGFDVKPDGPAACNIYQERLPIPDMKAKKNSVEIEGFRQAHIQDGAALVEFFSWLESTVTASDYDSHLLNEHEVAEREYEFRQKRKDFVGLSFDTISSTGPNAAIIHYKPPTEGSAKVVRNQIYLNDSGAQYLNGTTDVTRTVHFGEPTSEERDAYTRVLIGFIALSRARFPEGANGFMLDVLARNALWQAGMDYKHGTGHGVGHYLNVHEMPPYIGIWRGHDNSKFPLEAGMVTSIEPGYYEDGHFGIRIENLAVVVPSSTSHTNNGKFFEFEQLTMAPVAKNLINLDLLSEDDKAWLNRYHATVAERLSPLLSESALTWLKKATTPL